MRTLLPLVVLLIPSGIGYTIGYFRGKRNPDDYRLVAIREHAKLLRKSRRAYLFRQEGLANIYAEGAERVFESIDDEPKELNP